MIQLLGVIQLLVFSQLNIFFNIIVDAIYGYYCITITLCKPGTMKKCSLLFALTILFSGARAQGILRDWYGILSVSGTSLHLVFHITKVADKYSTTMDSPDQGANGIPIDSTQVKGDNVTIIGSKYGLKYSGTFSADSNKIFGTFQQGAYSTALTLFPTKTTVVTEKAKTRPQDPTDFPYKQEEVRFVNPVAKDTLGGTLTLPSDGKVSRIVILITGSGPQNRNEELLDHRPFLVWSDWLTRNGIAVLRYDDRGIAKSTGNFKTATSADFADDVEAAVRYIKSRSDLSQLSIGLMGHSEGGMIAPIVASRDKDVKFIVLLAGPGVPIVDLMLKQNEDQMKLLGNSNADITKALIKTKALYKLIVENAALPTAELKIRVDSLLYRQLKPLEAENHGKPSIEENINNTDRVLLGPWFRYFLAFDPRDYLAKVKCPVLALDGSLDMQVNAEANLASIQKTLIASGNKQVQIVEFPGMNHLFQLAKTGSVAEYSQIETTVDPVVLKKVSDWISKLQ